MNLFRTHDVAAGCDLAEGHYFFAGTGDVGLGVVNLEGILGRARFHSMRGRASLDRRANHGLVVMGVHLLTSRVHDRGCSPVQGLPEDPAACGTGRGLRSNLRSNMSRKDVFSNVSASFFLQTSEVV